MSDFNKSLDYTFANEGGFSNVKEDRGGATKYGITIAELSRWRKRPVSVSEVQNLGVQEAKAIYRAKYWDPLDLDFIKHDGIATCLFDIGVVRGISIPPKYAQEICNILGHHLVVDGHIGPKTIKALNSVDPRAFVRAFAKRAEQGFLAIIAARPSQIKFKKGWLNRARRLVTLA